MFPNFNPLLPMGIRPVMAPPPGVVNLAAVAAAQQTRLALAQQQAILAAAANTAAVAAASGVRPPQPMLVPPGMVGAVSADASPAPIEGGQQQQQQAGSAPGAAPKGGDGKSRAAEAMQWSEHTTTDGRTYYYNSQTKESVWTKPRALMTPLERNEGRKWKEYKTDEGRFYYFNVVTQKTQWEKPDDYEPPPAKDLPATSKAEAKDDDKKTENKGDDDDDDAFELPVKIEVKKVEVAQQSPVVVENVEEKVEKSASMSEMDRAMRATLASMEKQVATRVEHKRATQGKKSSHFFIPHVPVTEQELKQRQVDVFRELLRDKYDQGRVSLSSTWDQAVKQLQNDNRFRVIQKVSEKKQIFNAWKVQKQKDERDEKRLAIKKAKEELEAWLLQHPKVRRSVPIKYSRACQLFASEPTWKAVADDERRDIFDDMSKQAFKRVQDEEKSKRERNLKQFADVLSSMPAISHRTTWAQAQRLLIENPAFADDSTLQDMDKEDALTVFEQHIVKAEREFDKEREQEEARVRRHERKVREAFQNYLIDLHKQGTLTSMSYWSELWPTIAASPYLDAMLLQSGSTPLDLFKFYVEELKEKYSEHKKVVRQILQEGNHEVLPTTTLDELVRWVRADERGRDIDAGNLKLAYNSLMEKAESIQADREKETARKQRRLDSDLRHVIKELANPEVGPTTKWDEVKSRIERTTAYEAMPFDSDRERVFADYVRELAEACGHHHHGKHTDKKAKKAKKEKKKKSKKGEDEDDDEENGDEPPTKKRKDESGDKKKKTKKEKKRKRSDTEKEEGEKSEEGEI